MCWGKIRKCIQRTTAWLCVQDYGKDAVNPIEERLIITISSARGYLPLPLLVLLESSCQPLIVFRGCGLNPPLRSWSGLFISSLCKFSSSCSGPSRTKIRRRRALKSVHFLLAAYANRNTENTHPTIVIHTKIKVLPMKFISSLKLYN